MTSTAIRPAHPSDRQRILELVENAFGSSEEVDLVRRIWASDGYQPALDLVAVADEEILGHALFSIGALGETTPVPALAPLAVHPDHQNQGIGSALVADGLERCDVDRWPVVVVTGHPDYYPRFGFEPATPLGIHPTNPAGFADLRAFMAQRLHGYDGEAGTYRYCWEIDDPGGDDLTHESFPLASSYDRDWLLSLDMGPNPLWLLEELLADIDIEPGARVLDLGCGKGATSVFLANELDVEVWAVDLWVPDDVVNATMTAADVEEAVHVDNADVRALPYENGFFDAIVSIDAWGYFGTDDYLLPSLLRVLRPGGQIGMATPAMRHDVRDLGHIPDHICDVVGWEALAWHPPDWWKQQWELTGLVNDVRAREAATGWHDWLRWSRASAGDNAHDDPVVGMLTTDSGRLLTFALVTGVKA